MQVIAEQFMDGPRLEGSMSKWILLRPWQIVKLLEVLPMTLIPDLLRRPVKRARKDLEILEKAKQLLDWIKTNDHGPRQPLIGGA